MGKKKDDSCGLQKSSFGPSVGGLIQCLLNGVRFKDAYRAFNEAVLEGVLSADEVAEIYNALESFAIELNHKSETVPNAFDGLGFRTDGHINNPDGSCTYRLVSVDVEKPFIAEVTIRIDNENKDKYKTPQIQKVEQMMAVATAEKNEEKLVALRKIHEVLMKLNKSELDSLGSHS